jgi:hypothetical protein
MVSCLLSVVSCLLSPVFRRRLDVQRDLNAQARQMCHKMKDMPLDPAKAVQWENHAGQHSDAKRL